MIDIQNQNNPEEIEAPEIEEWVENMEDDVEEIPMTEEPENNWVLSREEVDKRFGTTTTVNRPDVKEIQHEDLRLRFKEFVWTINQLTPEGRAKSLMLTDLESASMWAHKAVAND